MPESFYYDCPVEAAYMAKHQRLKIAVKNSPGLAEDFGDFEDWTSFWVSFLSGEFGVIRTVIASDAGEHFYVHPDSLSMLEPVHGDALYGRCGGDFLRVKNTPIFTGEISPPDAKQAILAGFVIIQRDGKHFHWPKCEALP